MKEQLLSLFNEYPQGAFLISILLSILVALPGILPSVFITAANLYFFGFWVGLLVSFIGEALGALMAFLLYRRGFRRLAVSKLDAYPKAKRLVEAEGREAFMLIFSLRLLPFIPSGLVSFAAAIGRVTTGGFFLASSLGKIPALFIEAWSVYEITKFGWQGKLILFLAAIILIILAFRKLKKKPTNFNS